MAGQLPRITAAKVTGVLQRHGFNLISQPRSHQKCRRPNSGNQVILPYYKGKQLPLGTLNSIIDGSGIAVEEFRK